MNWRDKPGRARRITAALLILAVAVLAGVLPVAAERPNGAGLVIRHGDGSLIYAYVQFEEESISGEELLYRSGLDMILQPFSGLGMAVCSINGEGCPADNCFCQSYGNPSYYWHYYALVDGAWRGQMIGPSSRQLQDGDVDGWSWTAGESGLPNVTIDEIAAMNGVDRSAPDPTPTPEPPTPTPVPTETPVPPTPTPEPPTPTPTTPPPVVAPADPTATATSPPATVAVAAASPTTPATATPSPEPTHTPTATPNPSPTPTIPRTIIARATTAAVIIAPDGTPTVLNIVEVDEERPRTNYVAFGVIALVAVATGAAVYVRNRGMVSDGDPPS